MEMARSQHLDSMFSQVDDLQARLKITVQRMATLEADLVFSEDQKQNLLQAHRNLQDQLMVWKEKERLWLERQEKADLITRVAQAKDFEIMALRAENHRFIKYHEKIKLQVKPYIRQLKDYSKSLLQEIQDLKRELLNREYAVTKAIERQKALEKGLDEQVTLRQRHELEMQNLFANQNEGFKREVEELRSRNKNLQQKAEKLEEALERQDELQNMTISLKRKLDTLQARHDEDTEGLRASLQMARNELLKKNLMLETLQQQNLEQKQIIHQLQDPGRAQQEVTESSLQPRVPQVLEP
jgi:chromosome segregation ATPase